MERKNRLKYGIKSPKTRIGSKKTLHSKKILRLIIKLKIGTNIFRKYLKFLNLRKRGKADSDLKKNAISKRV